jgi:hypothetical protein
MEDTRDLSRVCRLGVVDLLEQLVDPHLRRLQRVINFELIFSRIPQDVIQQKFQFAF